MGRGLEERQRHAHQRPSNRAYRPPRRRQDPDGIDHELEEDYQIKMYDAALHDGLTRAYNKRYFLDRLPTETAYALRHGTPLSLLMLDVDHFKKVNDEHGHPAGDYVLASLGQVIV